MSRLTDTPPMTRPSTVMGLTVDSIQISRPSRSRTLPSPRQGRPSASAARRSFCAWPRSIRKGSNSPNGRPRASDPEYPKRRAAEGPQNVIRLSRSVAKTPSWTCVRTRAATASGGSVAETGGRGDVAEGVWGAWCGVAWPRGRKQDRLEVRTSAGNRLPSSTDYSRRVHRGSGVAPIHDLAAGLRHPRRAVGVREIGGDQACRGRHGHGRGRGMHLTRVEGTCVQSHRSVLGDISPSSRARDCGFRGFSDTRSDPIRTPVPMVSGSVPPRSATGPGNGSSCWRSSTRRRDPCRGTPARSRRTWPSRRPRRCPCRWGD